MRTKTRPVRKNVRGRHTVTRKSEYTLVIVDMQPQFPDSSKEETLAAVEREIRFAMKNKAAIVFLEYLNWGDTHNRLTEPTYGYDRCVVACKGLDDGSPQVLSTCAEHGFSSRRLRVCGVHTHACVEATVIGLIAQTRQSTVEVVKEACNDAEGNDWDDFPTHRRIKLVSTHS